MQTKKKTTLIIFAAIAGAAVLVVGGYITICSLLVSAPQLDVEYNTSDDLPEGIDAIYVNKVGKCGGTYHVVAEAGGAEYTFRLAENFTAQAFEPGVAGALYKNDYNSPEDFRARWYELSEERGMPGGVFAFSFAGDKIVSLMDTSEPSPPNGP